MPDIRPPRADRVAALRILPTWWEPGREQLHVFRVRLSRATLTDEERREVVWMWAHALANMTALPIAFAAGAESAARREAVARALRIWCLVTADRVTEEFLAKESEPCPN